MPQLSSLGSLAFGILLLGRLAVAEPAAPLLHEAPAHNRAIPLPAWHLDVTSRFEREAPAPGTPPLARGELVRWTAQIEIPEGRDLSQPLVLEFDEGRVLSSAWLAGQEVALPLDRRGLGSRFQSGESRLFLPGGQPGDTILCEFEVADLTHLYPNAFGRVFLRPSRLDERLALQRVRGDRTELENRAPVVQAGEARIDYLDFFGTPLKSRVVPFSLEPDQKLALDLSEQAPENYWKCRVVLEQGDESSFEYWHYPDAERYLVTRDSYQRLDPKGWQRIPGPAEGEFAFPLPTEGAESVDLPHRPAPADCPTHRMWYVRNFTVPAEWEGQAIDLFLHRVILRAEVFVDGQRVGSLYNWEMPGTLDLSAHLSPGGTHQLAIGVTDFTVAIRPDIDPIPNGTQTAPGESLAAAVGYLPGEGTPSLECVPELWARPKLHTQRAIIRTDVEGGNRFSAEVAIDNRDATARTTQLHATILEAGEERVTFPPEPITIPAGEVATVDLARDWPEARLWAPEHPTLYELRLELREADGTTIDLHRERFGFREFGIVEDRFTLNGHLFKPYGTGHLMPRLNAWPYIPTPHRVYRHHLKARVGFLAGIDTNWLADEMGVLVKDENLSHNAHFARRFAYDLDLTFDRLFAEMEAVYKFRPNLASTWIWDIGNELNFHKPNEVAKMGKLYERLRAMDPTRYVTNSGGNGDPEEAEIVDTHHNTSPYDRFTWWFRQPESRPDYLEDYGVYAYIPDGAADRDWTYSHHASRDRLTHTGGKPVLFSESLNCNSFLRTAYTGSQAYRSLPHLRPGFESRTGAESLDWAIGRRVMIEYGRQAELSGWLCHVDRAFTRAISPVAAFPLDRAMRFERGEPIALRFTLHNDRNRPETPHFVATLRQGAEVLATHEHRAALDPAEMVIHAFDFDTDLPVGDYDLTWEFTTPNGDSWYRHWDRLRILPRAESPDAAILRFDPQDRLEEALPTAEQLTDLTAWTGQTPLLIAPDALEAIPVEAIGHLRQLVNAGARLAVLEHDAVPAILENQPENHDRRLNAVATIDPHSAFTADLDHRDFQFWRTRQDDHIVTRGGFQLPKSGEFRAHLAFGTRMSIDHSPLLEISSGRGEVLFSQLNFADALGEEPMATLMLHRIVDWLASERPPVDSTTALLSVDQVAFREVLIDQTGVIASLPDGEWTPDDFTHFLIHGEDSGAWDQLEKHAEALKRRLDEGAQLIVFDLNAASAARLNTLLGTSLSTAEWVHSQTHLTRLDPLVAGLTTSDFLWALSASDGYSLLPRTSQPPIGVETGDTIVEGPEFVSLTDPAYLGYRPLGKGRVTAFNLRSLDYPIPESQRVLNQVLRNAGVEIATGDAQGVDRWTGKRFQPVPLPDVTETREKSFQNVAFEIAVSQPERAIDGGLSIPLDLEAEQLVFLYGSENGATPVELKIWNEDRARWIPTEPDPFTRLSLQPELDILASSQAGKVVRGERFLPGAEVAWHEGGQGYFMKVWDNPRPDKRLESIDITLPEDSEARPFLVAVTAVVRSEPRPDLTSVLPANVKPDQVLTHWQNDRYGIVIQKNGTISVIHNAKGEPLVAFPKWGSQGSQIRPSGNRFRALDDSGRLRDLTASQEITEMGLPRFVIRGRTDYTEATQVITLGAESVEIESTFETLKPFPEEWPANVTSRFEVLASGLDTKTFSTPNLNPIRVGSDAGFLEVQFSKDWRSWYKGYNLRGSTGNFSAFRGNPEVGDRGTLIFRLSFR